MIQSKFTFKQLEAFVFVVDTGTFRAAAKALGTTQPNISTRISALETALGTTLFYRNAGSVRLTDRGHVLLVRARDVLWAGETLLEEAGRQDLIEERLRLGVTELVACTWLQGFLQRLKKSYPHLRVELQVDLSVNIGERLGEGLLDLALQNGPFENALPGTVTLGIEKYVWVANADLAAKLGGSADLARFFEHPVLTHAKNTGAGLSLHEVAKARGYDSGQIVHSSALSACIPMVNEGLGVALLPQALVRTLINDGQLTQLACDWLPKPLTFYARYRTQRAARYVEKAAHLAADAMAAGKDQENLSPLEDQSI